MVYLFIKNLPHWLGGGDSDLLLSSKRLWVRFPATVATFQRGQKIRMHSFHQSFGHTLKYPSCSSTIQSPPPIGFLTACELLSEIKPQSLISQFHRYLNKIIGVDPVLELPLVAAQQIFCSIVVTDMPYILTLLPLQKN